MRSRFVIIALAAISQMAFSADSSSLAVSRTSFVGPRAFYEWIQILTSTYAWTITYEEPMWAADSASVHLYPSAGAVSALGPVRRLLDDHFEARDALGKIDQGDESVLSESVKLYNRQGNKARFRVARSDGLIHVLPESAVTNQIQALPLLDTTISINELAYSPTEAVKAIADELSHQRGLDVAVDIGAFGFAFDKAYTGDEGQKFHWSVRDRLARDALSDLLSQSLTTTVWRVFCQPLDGGKNSCTISLTPLLLKIERADGKRQEVPLYFDRGGPKFSPPPIALQ